jgi:hypothetical protein
MFRRYGVLTATVIDVSALRRFHWYSYRRFGVTPLLLVNSYRRLGVMPYLDRLVQVSTFRRYAVPAGKQLSTFRRHAVLADKQLSTFRKTVLPSRSG